MPIIPIQSPDEKNLLFNWRCTNRGPRPRNHSLFRFLLGKHGGRKRIPINRKRKLDESGITKLTVRCFSLEKPTCDEQVLVVVVKDNQVDDYRLRQIDQTPLTTDIPPNLNRLGGADRLS